MYDPNFQSPFEELRRDSLIELLQLLALTLKNVDEPCAVLAALWVPSIRTIVVVQRQFDPFGSHADQAVPFTSVAVHWTQPGCIPSALRSLTLSNVFKTPSDVAPFVSLLVCCRALVLSLQSEMIGKAAHWGDLDSEDSISWRCPTHILPKLMYHPTRATPRRSGSAPHFESSDQTLMNMFRICCL